MSRSQLLYKFHQNSFTNFSVIQPSDKQTNKLCHITSAFFGGGKANRPIKGSNHGVQVNFRST